MMGSRSWKPRRRLSAAAVTVAVAASLVLAGCSEANNNGQNSLQPKGPAAQKIDNLFIPILIIAIVIGIAVVIATVYFALKFRYRAGKTDNPKQIHGNTPLEIGWTIVPRPDPRGRRRAHDQPRSSTWPRSPKARRAAGHRRRQAVVVGVRVPRRQGRHRQRAGHPRRPAGAHPVAGVRSRHLQRDPLLLGPRAGGKKDVVPGRTNELTHRGRRTGDLPGAVRGVLRAGARRHALPGDRGDAGRLRAVGREQQQGPAQPLLEARAPTGPAGPAQELIATKYECTNCHTFDDSTTSPRTARTSPTSRAAARSRAAPTS